MWCNAGVPISHEKIGKVGTVSWIHAVPFRPDLAELEVFFSDSQSVKLRESPDFQFSPVVSENDIHSVHVLTSPIYR